MKDSNASNVCQVPSTADDAPMSDTAGRMQRLFAQLNAADAEGLVPNLRRFLTFLGWTEGEVIELQALHVPANKAAGRWRDTPCLAAHASTLASLEALATLGDAFGAQGVYAIFNRIDPGVQYRRGPDAWREVPKGEGTSDRDITHRRALYIDLDPQRTRGISATDEELDAALERAEQAREILLRTIPAEAIGFGLSGNGAALFVALEPMSPEGEPARLVKSTLVALAALLDDEAVKVDTSVSDAKRLCFLPGTMKRKGADCYERPHRRALFLGPEVPRRLTLDELRALVMALRDQLPEDRRAEVDKELAGPTSKGAPRTTTASAPASAPRSTPQRGEGASSPPQTPCEVANHTLPVQEVLARLGLLEEDRPICPGCRESDKGVAVVGNGLKCLHNRCSNKGHRNGFRSVVDLVMEAEALDVPGALAWIRREFPGFLPELPPRQNAPSSEPGQDTIQRQPQGAQAQSQKAPREDKGAALVKMLEELVFFRSPTGRLFMAYEGEALACESTRYMEVIAGLFWRRFQVVLNRSSIEDATRIRASRNLEVRPVAVRIQGSADRLLLDLGQGGTWQVTADGDQVGPIDDPIPWFRPSGSSSLPAPQIAVSDEESAQVFAELRELLDVADDGSWAAILAWLFACLRPVGPYPLLILRGEKGSGKSTLARALRRLVDPRKPELKTLPPKGNEALRTLAISAEHAHVLVFDNLSSLDGDLSDALCRLSTGDGFEVRKMYAGRDLEVFENCSPVLLTSITEAATRADLLDRSLLVRLPARQRRVDDDLLEATLTALAPRVLGALLWAAHRAMVAGPTTDVPGSIRMRAPARWAAAAESALGLPPGAVVAAYLASREESEALEAEDPFLTALFSYLEDKGGNGFSWKTTAEKLLKTLTVYAYPPDQRERPPAGWPQSARGARARLDRSAAALRAGGVEVSYSKEGHANTRTITLTRHPSATPYAR